MVDRYIGVLTGSRPTILDEECVAVARYFPDTYNRLNSFDLDFPIIVDDSCWDLADAENKFPLKPSNHGNEPCEMQYFICTLKLTQIIAYILRTLVSPLTPDQHHTLSNRRSTL